MSIFKPSLIVRSIYQIDGAALQRAGIKGIILNWTNTLLPMNADSVSDDMQAWLNEFKTTYAFEIVIVSNSKPPERGNELIREIPHLFEAGKPLKKAFKAALKRLGTSTNETAVIGNGLITDMWGGNRLGLFTIFVSPSWTKPRFVGAMKWMMVKILRF
ncbi:YqeG family HAD IIIA-type phosphatase [Paenibacillus silvisoli]|uniref:YqeG family HAD IIIA-type phosphatase n=1 Tax=Paenibacillus silvisoli TaxID=3110539 RepID=UPI002803AE5A|nr:YqeG family HAD IIIA-type phosphatase [Paenibacillus silvisoli]